MLELMRSICKKIHRPQALILAALYFLSMATTLAANRIAERKLRDKAGSPGHINYQCRTTNRGA